MSARGRKAYSERLWAIVCEDGGMHLPCLFETQRTARVELGRMKLHYDNDCCRVVRVEMREVPARRTT